MCNHWHVLVRLIVLLVLRLACVVHVGHVSVSTLEYLVNFWRLLHRALGNGALTRLRRQLRIVFPTTD